MEASDDELVKAGEPEDVKVWIEESLWVSKGFADKRTRKLGVPVDEPVALDTAQKIGYLSSWLI